MRLYPALAILSAATLVAAVWAHRRRTALARLGAPEDILARARRGGYRLIDTEELELMHRENNNHLLLVDTRPWPGFQAGHIKDAVCFPLVPTWWARWSCRQVLAALLGPDQDRAIVFY